MGSGSGGSGGGAGGGGRKALGGGGGKNVEDLAKGDKDLISAYSGAYIPGMDRLQGINAEELNKHLYNAEWNSLQSAAQQAAAKGFQKELDAALNKIKSSPGTTYRVVANPLVGVGEAGLASQYVPGQVAKFNAFLSTASTKNAASFSYESAAAGSVRLTIKGKTGKSIAKVSEYAPEKEILFGSGKKFMVNSRTWNTSNRTWDIAMTEI